jgi:hypothetical protein
MRLDLHNAIAIVVDIQERLYPHIHAHEAMAQRCAMLIRGLRILGVPIMVTEQYVKGLGRTIPEVADALGTYDAYEKISFSCCGDGTFESELVSHARHQVILMGIETHVCVLQTALDLLASGNTVVIVEDCVSSRRDGDKRVAIERIRHAGGIITTAESLLFELLRKAGTDTFKQISNLVK